MQLPANYDLYIFDFDGTIIDTLPNWLLIYQKVFSEYGLRPSDHLIIDIAFYNHDRINELITVDKEHYLEKVTRIKHELRDQVQCFPGAISLLMKLVSDNKKIALCTSSFKRMIDPITHLTGLDKVHFDQIVTGDTLKQQKPDPEGVNRILSTLNVPPSRTLYVGDSYPDLLTSQNAGIDFLWMDIPTNKPFILEAHYEVLKKQSKYQMTSYT